MSIQHVFDSVTAPHHNSPAAPAVLAASWVGRSAPAHNEITEPTRPAVAQANAALTSENG